MTIQELRRELSSFEETEFNGGVSDELIRTAAATVGLPFPPQYQAFLREFGSGYVSSEEFIGLGGPTHLNVAWLTNELRNRPSETRFPPTMIPVRADGFGNYDCIDTTKPTAGGEFQVVEWLHDGGNDQECKGLSDSYFGWMADMLRVIGRLEADDRKRDIQE